MGKYQNVITLLISSALLLGLSVQVEAAEESSCSNVVSAHWLLGEWQSKGEKTLVLESWKMTGAGQLQGIGKTISLNNNKSPFVESLRIIKMAGEIFFVAKPPQNELPVAFKLIECSDKHLRFKNATHDFPQVIEYQKISTDQIKASVSAKNNKGFDINFNRTKQAQNDNAEIISRYVTAYNQKNLTEMMKYTTHNIHWMSVSNNNVSVETKSKAELTKALKGHFSRAKKSHSSLSGISSYGSFVSAIEKSTAIRDGKKSSACSLSVYEFSKNKGEENLIKNVWYYDAEECD